MSRIPVAVISAVLTAMPPAWAQDGPQDPAAATQVSGEGRDVAGEASTRIQEEIVVTGTRLRQRSVTDSLVPIDVISSDEVARQGSTELDMLLRNVVPSFNISATSGDAGVVVRPTNLRGLAPDHTLVLIDGKRRHRGAVILWSRIGVSHGAQGPDLSAIPAIALRQVEVLRDGASAQYGSDAIAGVMNFLLKDADSGGALEFRAGGYGAGDGESAIVAGNIGLPWGDGGFVNLSMEYGGARPTVRAVQRADAELLLAAGNAYVADPAQRWGSADVADDVKLWVNLGRPLRGETEVYGHANYASRLVGGRNFFFRNPNTRSAVFSADGGATLLVGDRLDAGDGVVDGSAGCPVVTVTNGLPDPAALDDVRANPHCFTFQERFPGGFQPAFGGDRADASVVGGLRGVTAAGTMWDLSLSVGANEVDFYLHDSVNASLGLETPTDFHPGFYRQQDTNVNLDVFRSYGSRLQVAGGLEWRNEGFTIGLGDAASWQIGPYAPQGFSAGSNGFPGFSPIAAGKWNRANAAVYGEIEYGSDDGSWGIGAALRLEDYEDFGSAPTGKLSGRIDASPGLAFRGSVSTGFRAPTPGQQNAFNVSTQWAPELMDLVNNGTIPSTSRVAALRGGEQLEAENSLNIAVGAVLELDALTLTADLFRIDLEDRLGVTQLFALQPDEVDQLLAEGITSAANLANFRFFANDFKTRTEGVDLVAAWRPAALAGRTEIALAYNLTETEVVTWNPDLLDNRRIREIEEALPDTRWNLTVNHAVGRFDLLARLGWFDRWFDARDNWTYDGSTFVDLEAAMRLNASIRLTIGTRNALDNEAGRNPNPTAIGNIFSTRAPFDTNGAYYYVRFAYRRAAFEAR